MERKQERKRKKIDRLYYRFYQVLFPLFMFILTIFLIANVLKRDRDFSEMENRKLDGKPKFSLSSFIKKDYKKDFSSYFSDQFIFRNSLMKINLNTKLISGKKELNDVYIAREGYLIGKNPIEINKTTDERIEEINKFAQKNKVKTSFMMVPSSEWVNRDKLPKLVKAHDEKAYIDHVYQGLDKKINKIDILEDLEKSDQEVYYRTDHHWTSEGAFIAYQKMAKSLDYKKVKAADYETYQVANDFRGSLDNKINGVRGKSDIITIYQPKEETDMVIRYEDEKKKTSSLYDSKKLDIKDKYQVFTGGNHSLIKIRTENLNERKALIVKDSYTNALLPFIAPNYETLLVVDLRYEALDLKELIEMEGIEEVIFIYSSNIFQNDSSLSLIN